jgi:hypothetical protein
MNFELKPFRENNIVESLRVAFVVCRNTISIKYAIEGDISEVYWPDLNSCSTRETGLWERTCLEFFIGPAASPEYWEFNLSPGGNWNCFSFSDVRRNMKESDALVLVGVTVEKSATTAWLTADIRMSQLFPESLSLGLSAVIESTSGHFYHALGHGEKPDFHDRQNHLLVQQRDL